MARKRLSELLVDPGALAPAPGEGLEELRARLAARTGAGVRTIPLSSASVLLDLGPKGGSPGLAAAGPVANGSEVARLWVATGFSRPVVNLSLAPALARADAELAGSPPDETSGDARLVKALSDNWIRDPILVEQAVTPLSYRIYPDTPISEVVQLMLRRGIRAVPVVGKELEVLGVITGGDLLPHTLPDGGDGGAEGEGRPPVTARDIMTRTVLCVSEEQSLLEASRAMVSRGVGQLPVVREGEMIGFLDRATVMRAFADTVDLTSRAGA